MSDTNIARGQLHQQLAPLVYSDDEASRLIAAYRDEVLAEAAELVAADTAHIRYGSATEYAHRHSNLLLAARTSQSDGWVVCSPEWLAAGGDCHGTPRRPATDSRYSHEHFAARTTTAPTSQEH